MGTSVKNPFAAPSLTAFSVLAAVVRCIVPPKLPRRVKSNESNVAEAAAAARACPLLISSAVNRPSPICLSISLPYHQGILAKVEPTRNNPALAPQSSLLPTTGIFLKYSLGTFFCKAYPAVRPGAIIGRDSPKPSVAH